MKELFKEKLAWGEYILIENDNTLDFYQEVVKEVNNLVKEKNCSVAKAVARVVYDKTGDRGYFWRSLKGGCFVIQDMIKRGPNCLDYCVIVKTVLEKNFNVKGEIKETKLVLVNNHRYFLTDRGEVLDLIVGIPKYPEGYFKTEEIYLEELKKINSKGIKIALQQIKAILFPQTREKL